MGMLRTPEESTITIGVTAAASTPISTVEWAGGSYQLPAGSGTTEVTLYAQVGSEEFAVANDEDGNPLTPVTVSAGLPYPLPSVSYNYPRIKLVASAGDATALVPLFKKS